jgi:autotransporter-associated beta strand protein
MGLTRHCTFMRSFVARLAFDFSGMLSRRSCIPSWGWILLVSTSGCSATGDQKHTGGGIDDAGLDADVAAGAGADSRAPMVDGDDGAAESATTDASRDASAPPPIPPPACANDVTAQILANVNIVLTGDSCVTLPPGTTTQYDAVITGAGTLTVQAPGGPATLVVTADSTFSLPASRQTETAVKTANYYAIEKANTPAVFVEPGATLQLGTSTSAAGSIASYLPNTGTAMINADNIEVDGVLAMGGGPTEHFGVLSGAGTITQPGNPGPYATGTFYLVGDDSFSGVLSILTGGQVGDLGVTFSLPYARAIFSNGSMIMNSPPTAGYRLPEPIYESHYGDDINTDHGLVTFTGVYGYSDSGDPVHPSLTDPALNTMVVTNTSASPHPGNGSNASFRGINLEGGTTEWGDGTTNDFFLPSTPAPADPGAKNVKNAYINLRNNGNNSTLVFNYNGKYTCNIGITGGGGGPHAGGDVGDGNLALAATPGNYAVLTMPQNYNGTTTIGAGATLQLGNGGTAVQAIGATVGAPTASEPSGAVTTSVLATYSGDSSLLTAESPNGSTSDAIVDDGTLIVNNGSTATSLSNISGSGSFVQLGAAATTLLANSYSGGTTISGGSLLVGAATSLGTGSVVNDATFGATGGQHGIDVAGDYRQGAAGTLVLAFAGPTPGSTYDTLTVAGAATLAGTLSIDVAPGFAPAVGQQFTVVEATGGISGTFSTLSSPSVKLALSYDATHCYATVTP